MKDIKNFSGMTGLSAEKHKLLAYLLEEEGIELPQTQTISLRENPEELPLSFSQQQQWLQGEVLEPSLRRLCCKNFRRTENSLKMELTTQLLPRFG